MNGQPLEGRAIVVNEARPREDRPGGAANVARNAAALGARVTILSVVGQDEPGRRLRELLREESINARLHYDRTIDTTVKLRVIGRQQQLLRIDFETQPSHEILRTKLSDYAKLVAAHKGRVLLVDFWATWCAVCRFEQDTIDELARVYADAKPDVVVIVGDDQEELFHEDNMPAMQPTPAAAEKMPATAPV